jgi:hypothetical protein
LIIVVSSIYLMEPWFEKVGDVGGLVPIVDPSMVITPGG